MRRESIAIIGLSLILNLSSPLLAEHNSLSLAIEQTLKARISRELNQGVVVAVVSQDGIHYYSAGTYREGDERSINEKTIFEIGSVTKVFTNLLTAEMVDRGEISLYDSIDKHLPASVNPPEMNGDKISLFHLATYLSGLPTRPYNLRPADQRNPYADYTVDQLYAFLNNYELKKTPGTTYEYSNFSVGLLGHILSLVNNDSYENILKERILSKLGMDETSVKLSETQRYHLARGHDGIDQMPQWEMPALPGAGALHSSAHDLAIFIQSQLGLVPSSLFTIMKGTQRPLADTQLPKHVISLGWHVRMTKNNSAIHWHSAMTAGHACFIGFSEAEKTGVVVLSNSATSLDDIGFFVLDPQNNSLRPFREIIELDSNQLKSYIGVYNFDKDNSLIISKQGEKLYGQLVGNLHHRIHPIGEDTFSYDVLNATITFKKDARGKVSRLEFTQGDSMQVAIKAN